MEPLIPAIVCALLGLASGIFLVLSLIEKPVWGLMWNRSSDAVPEDIVRAIQAQLKRVLHLLPPTMITTVFSLFALLIYQLFLFEFAILAWAVLATFVAQQFFIILRLKKDIDGVDGVPTDGDYDTVRSGLGALALLHHRGLLSTASTLIVQITFIAVTTL